MSKAKSLVSCTEEPSRFAMFQDAKNKEEFQEAAAVNAELKARIAALESRL